MFAMIPAAETTSHLKIYLIPPGRKTLQNAHILHISFRFFFVSRLSSVSNLFFEIACNYFRSGDGMDGNGQHSRKPVYAAQIGKVTESMTFAIAIQLAGYFIAAPNCH